MMYDFAYMWNLKNKANTMFVILDNIWTPCTCVDFDASHSLELLLLFDASQNYTRTVF